MIQEAGFESLVLSMRPGDRVLVVRHEILQTATQACSNWGLIDVRGIVRIIDAVRSLHGSPGLSKSDEREFDRWLDEFLDWLLTSENGKLERAAPNNHGTWYLYLTVGISRHLGRDAEAADLARENFRSD